jgi:hypothetical protein
VIYRSVRENETAASLAASAGGKKIALSGPMVTPVVTRKRGSVAVVIQAKFGTIRLHPQIFTGLSRAGLGRIGNPARTGATQCHRGPGMRRQAAGGNIINKE